MHPLHVLCKYVGSNFKQYLNLRLLMAVFIKIPPPPLPNIVMIEFTTSSIHCSCTFYSQIRLYTTFYLGSLTLSVTGWKDGVKGVSSKLEKVLKNTWKHELLNLVKKFCSIEFYSLFAPSSFLIWLVKGIVLLVKYIWLYIAWCTGW